MDSDLDGVADPSGKKISFEFSDYSTSYYLLRRPDVTIQAKERRKCRRSAALGLERGAGVLMYAGAERREKVAEIRC